MGQLSVVNISYAQLRATYSGCMTLASVASPRLYAELAASNMLALHCIKCWHDLLSLGFTYTSSSKYGLLNDATLISNFLLLELTRT